jgi:hypothetical protein
MMEKQGLQEGCPEWYRVEKETGKAVKMLTNLKELGFYLNNPDEYIRRLAILRINELKLKESMEALKDIADNPIESPQNRELAAWTIKCICNKWKIDLYVGSKLLGKYSGDEKYADLFRVSVSNTMPGPRLEMASSIIATELSEDADTIRHSEDIQFEVDFSIQEWFSTWFSDFAARSKALLASGPRALLPLLYKYVFLPAARCPGVLWSKIKTVPSASRSRRKVREKPGTPYRVSERKNVSFSQVLYKAFYGLLYVVFTPVRLLVRHAKPAVLLILIAYLLLTVSTPGRMVFYKYSGIDLYEVQSRAFYTARDFLAYSWSELKELVGIYDTSPYAELLEEESTNPIYEGNTETPTDKQYRVIAKTGLNLRSAPVSSATKIISQRLTYNATVTYLLKSQKDASGGLWYYVQTSDGTTGWAYAKWLQDMGGDKHAGE